MRSVHRPSPIPLLLFFLSAAVIPAAAVPTPGTPRDRFAAPVPSPAPAIPDQIPDSSSSGYGIMWGALLLIGGGVAAFKMRPVRCPGCKEKMKVLTAEETYLEPSEQVEERIGSVHYQLWVCPACGERKKTRRQHLFSGYESCPNCSAQTLESTRRTVEKATYSHDGADRVDDHCLSCSYHHTSTYSTPRLVDRSSSSPSSSS